MTRPVVLTPLAQADIRKAYVWYEKERPGLGERFIDRVESAIEKIADHPTTYAPIADDVRRVRVEKFPYALWFQIAADGSVVVACLHGKRDRALVKERALKPEPL